MPTNLSCFPRVGVCPNNNSHQIARVLPSNSKIFVNHQHCSKCLSPFDKTKYNGYYVSTHYYQCTECPLKICFQCAQPAQSEKKWSVRALPRQSMHTVPPINVGWLKVNEALNNVSGDGLEVILKKTIKLFGGARKMIQFITKNASRYDLQSIYRLALRQQRDSVQRNELESLPEEMHSNILGYLNRENIENLKMCSRRMSILCLAEMKKKTIGFIDGAKLMKHSNQGYSELGDYFVKTRYNQNKSMRSLANKWSQQTSIPKENQIFFTRDKYSLFKVSDKSQINHHVLLLDKTKIISMLDPHQHVLFDQNIVADNGVNIACLQYFDAMKQTVKVVQFIICSQNGIDLTQTNFVNYFANYFGNSEIDDVDNDWYRELKSIMNKMGDDSNVPKLLIQHLRRGLVIVQINPNHPWSLKNTQKWSSSNGVRYGEELPQSLVSFVSVSFEDKEILTKCMQKYYEKNLSEIDLKIFQPELDTMFDLINAKSVEYKVPSLRVLNEKLCNSLDHRIKPDQICYERHGLEKKICIGFPCIGLTLSKYTSPTFKINVFYSKDCPYTYQFGLSPIKVIRFMYKRQFTPTAFIEDLFETISKSTDHIFYDYCKELIDAYYDFDDSSNCKNKKENKNIQCILYEKEYEECVENYDIQNNVFGHGDGESFNLYMTPIIRQSSSKSIKLNIRFIVGKGLKYVGLPIDVWINKEDTLQFIVNKYLKKIRKFIVNCYKVKENNQKVLIHRYKWADYMMSHRMKLPNNIIVFMLDKKKMANISLPDIDLTTVVSK